MAQNRSKLTEKVVKGSFHQGDTSVFGQNSVGRQCVANCVIAGLYNSIVLVSNWTTHNLDNILWSGDKLYKSMSKTNSLLQVHDIGPQITASEFFGRIRIDKADNNIGSTLEKATFSVIQENKTDQYILCIGNEKGGAASLFISKQHCYIFDPHSRNSCGLPIDGGTSILASFKSRQNMISHIHVIKSVSQDSRQNPIDLYSMCVVSFNQVNIQMESYFIDQKYQYLKSKPLAKDAEKQKTFEYENYQMNNKKDSCKQGIAKHKNTQRWKSVPEKMKSECSQSEKSQNQTTEYQEKTHNKKSLRKQDISKEIKLKDRERKCKCRKNIQKIGLSKKDNKSLKKKVQLGRGKVKMNYVLL